MTDTTTVSSEASGLMERVLYEVKRVVESMLSLGCVNGLPRQKGGRPAALAAFSIGTAKPMPMNTR